MRAHATLCGTYILKCTYTYYTHTTTAVYAVHIKPHTTVVAADAAARHAHSDHVSRYGTVIIVASAQRPRIRDIRPLPDRLLRKKKKKTICSFTFLLFYFTSSRAPVSSRVFSFSSRRRRSLANVDCRFSEFLDSRIMYLRMVFL